MSPRHRSPQSWAGISVAARLGGRTRRAAAIYLLLAGLQRGISFIILPFISHAMTPEEYGAASILTASALLLVAIFAAPLEPLVFRVAARGDDDEASVIRVISTYCYVVLPLIVAIIAGGVALLLPEMFGVKGTVWAIELTAIGLVPAATYFAIPYVRARQDLNRFVWLALTSVILTAASKLALIVFCGLGVLGWAISDLVSAVLSASLAMALVRLPRARVALSHVRTVAGFAVPLIPHRASFWALSSLSRPATAMVSTLAQVGLLSFGLNLASIATMILTEINQAVMPRFSREKFPAPTAETLTPVRWQLVLAFTVPAIVGAGVALGGRWIFDEAYWASFALTGILLCGQVSVGLYVIPMNYLVQSAGLPKFSAVASVSGAMLIMVGIFVFGSRFGAAGVAYATAVGFVVMAVVALILTRALKLEIRWRSWRSCWPQTLVAITSLVCSVVALSLPVGSASAYGCAGVCVVLAMGALVITSRRSDA